MPKAVEKEREKDKHREKHREKDREKEREKDKKRERKEIKEQYPEPTPEIREESQKSKKEVEEPVVDGLVDTGNSESKVRHQPTRDSVLAELDNVIAMIDGELIDLKENPDRSLRNGSSKFLRNVNKQLKSIRGHSARVMKKTKTSAPRESNGNSVFQRPVKISNELAQFAGWPEDTPRSRVEVTKYICDYIREHNLQNPENRRQIIPDPPLQKILGYNPKKDQEPLYYYSIQSCLKNQNHFIKE